MLKFNLSWSFLGFLLACPIFGQAGKSAVPQEKDYKLWSRLHNEAISDDGNFLSYSVSYESGMDTLFVADARANTQLVIPQGSSGKFFGSHFLCRIGDTVKVFDLQKRTKWYRDKVLKCEFSGERIIFIAAANGRRCIEVCELAGLTLAKFDSVGAYTFNDRKTHVAFARYSGWASELVSLNLKSNLKASVIARDIDATFENIRWNTNGTGIVFVRSRNGFRESIGYFSVKERSLLFVSPNDSTWTLSAKVASHLVLSPDHSRVVFTMEANAVARENNHRSVMVWNSKSRNIPLKDNGREKPLRWIQWNIHKNRVQPLEAASDAIFSADLKYALTYGDFVYDPFVTQHGKRDLYLIDLTTERKVRVAEKISANPLHLKAGLQGSTFFYVKDQVWHLFDAEAKRDVALSKGEINIWEFAAWVDDGWSAIFYDKNDLILIKLLSGRVNRITDGYKTGTVYRMAGEDETSKDLLLRWRSSDYRKGGYARYQGKVLRLLADERKFSELLQSKRSNFSVISESFGTPPILLRCGAFHCDTIFKSNPHSDRFGKTKVEVINYRVGDETLSGVLCKPYGFDEAKNYPMIMHVYEKQGHLLHDYAFPSIYNPYGFNTAHFLAQGYFVFFPDINPTMGDPGYSATAQVVIAVNAAVKHAPIDRTRIALFGHSFGGYETNFIITQTDIFRCAVSGAGISNNISSYLTVDNAFHDVAYWRFESDQRRMGSTFWENKNRYGENSPVWHTDKVTTPLLSFVGGKDRQVPPSQSMEFHLALKRLGKEHVLLFYPDEGHIILNPDTQADLTHKVTDWLAHYLKDEPLPNWAVRE